MYNFALSLTALSQSGCQSPETYFYIVPQSDFFAVAGKQVNLLKSDEMVMVINQILYKFVVVKTFVLFNDL